MRGSLRLRHQQACPAAEAGRSRDARACRCAPAVIARIRGVERTLGHLPRSWRSDDLVPFERELADLRELVLTGRTPVRPRVVTLAEWAGPWFEGIASQVEAGRMSPLTFNDYEGAWRLYLEPAFSRMPLGGITHQEIVKFTRADRGGPEREPRQGPAHPAVGDAHRRDERGAHRQEPVALAAAGPSPRRQPPRLHRPAALSTATAAARAPRSARAPGRDACGIHRRRPGRP